MLTDVLTSNFFIRLNAIITYAPSTEKRSAVYSSATISPALHTTGQPTASSLSHSVFKHYLSYPRIMTLAVALIVLCFACYFVLVSTMKKRRTRQNVQLAAENIDVLRDNFKKYLASHRYSAECLMTHTTMPNDDRMFQLAVDPTERMLVLDSRKYLFTPNSALDTDLTYHALSQTDPLEQEILIPFSSIIGCQVTVNAATVFSTGCTAPDKLPEPECDELMTESTKKCDIYSILLTVYTSDPICPSYMLSLMRGVTNTKSELYGSAIAFCRSVTAAVKEAMACQMPETSNEVIADVQCK